MRMRIQLLSQCPPFLILYLDQPLRQVLNQFLLSQPLRLLRHHLCLSRHQQHLNLHRKVSPQFNPQVLVLSFGSGMR
jgi:hypothetical protein